MKKIFFLAVVAFIFLSCEHHYVDWIDFKNNSENDIYFYIAWCGGGIYPDTTLSFHETKLSKIKAKGGFSEEYKGVQNIEDEIQSLPQGVLSIYFFSKDTLEKYSWEEVQSGYKILKRYDLNASDIKKINRVVSYPPIEVMKGMKMYPAYGSEEE